MTREDSPCLTADAQDEALVPTETRRPYQKPVVVAYGRVEDMTRAGTKSGAELSKKPRFS